MSPPPSTPTPRRFLLAKRGTQSSQTPTGPPRFQSTSRFGSSSVPRPTQGRADIDIEDVEEDEDPGGDSPGDGGEGALGTRNHGPLNDSIEVESDDVEASQNDSLVISDDEADSMGQEFIERESSEPLPHDSSPLEEREPKRRKVSISPLRESSPLDGHDPPANENLGGTNTREHTPSSQGSVESLQDIRSTHDETKAAQQPTFRAPPRFKPTEIGPTAEGLPAAFSPQRRGTKYVAGGLAAELQGWLSEVKGHEGVVPHAAPGVKVAIEEIRPGRRMYLVRGRTDPPRGTPARRFLLAGEGRLTGLGQRAAVGVGSVVEVGQPVWDVELDGEVWTVACDWGVS
ncbi:hypothetical protein FZEAL_6591 [Fusarium zealandicum]|uniref:Uncharacterized protein n=1 Tax=Fusarium zealandicum TaxID=1053134 RepID=A0A8H4UI83_9HYPO|nr:hypothetical protein FZEAL_6591 [Fusarium zealandicum]